MLTFIDFESGHFPVLRSWFNSERDLVQWGGPDLTYPLPDHQLEGMILEASTVPPRRFCWMGVNANHALSAHIQLAWDWKNGVARIARVMIAPEMRGRGLAAYLIGTALEKAFSYPEIERAELNVYSWNVPAIRTYTKMGFSHEGVRRSSVKVGDERWDTAMMGVLRREWEITRGR